MEKVGRGRRERMEKKNGKDGEIELVKVEI